MLSEESPNGTPSSEGGRHSTYATCPKKKACLPFQVMLPLNLSLFLLAFALSPGNRSYTVCRDTASTVVVVNNFHGPECS